MLLLKTTQLHGRFFACYYSLCSSRREGPQNWEVHSGPTMDRRARGHNAPPTANLTQCRLCVSQISNSALQIGRKKCRWGEIFIRYYFLLLALFVPFWDPLWLISMEKSILWRPLLVGTSCPTPSDLRFGIIHRLLPISDRGNNLISNIINKISWDQNINFTK